MCRYGFHYSLIYFDNIAHIHRQTQGYLNSKHWLHLLIDLIFQNKFHNHIQSSPVWRIVIQDSLEADPRDAIIHTNVIKTRPQWRAALMLRLCVHYGDGAYSGLH